MTESDNTTYDLYRFLALFSVVVALGLVIHSSVYLGVPIDLQSYGIGMGSLFGGLGVALSFKHDTPINPDKC